MNLSLYIAKRYLFSKKNRNAINIISGISIVVVAIATAAIVIVLSSINGFGTLIDKQISSYAPDLKIQAVKGKTFRINNEKFLQIKNLKALKYFAEITEENILLKYDNKQTICTVKGIPDDYAKQFNLKSALRDGIFKISGKVLNYAVIGGGIAYKLGISTETGKSVSIWTPNRKRVNLLNPEQAFNRINLIPAGIISIDSEFDLKYILTSNKVVRKITDRDSSTVSSIEILSENPEQIESLKSKIKNILGDDYTVHDVYEQFDVYRVMKSERLAAFIIMLFITLIASFSIIGSVTMLIIEKRRDIFTLLSMGATINRLKRIFFIEGWLISFTGALIGIILGGVVCWAQKQYGFITFPSDGMYIVDAYPVSMKLSDFILTFLSVMSLGTVISLYPAAKLKSEFIKIIQSV
ncbi:MAG: ABC transporter permease [Chlorobi bacterium]|nr:ABC transporter permease [Chlorobiota bacterium]